MKVYTNHYGNPFADYVFLVADIAGVKVEEVIVADKNAIKDKLPTGKFPTLEVDGVSIFESNAIARYFAKLKPESNLYGKTVFESS
jgi:glutathione S-transferase